MKKLNQFILLLISLFLFQFARPQTGSQIISTTGVENGLCINLGTLANAQLEMELTNAGKILVQGIALSETNLVAARQNIENAGMAGIVTVEYYPNCYKLPYADNLVNLLVADMDILGIKAPSIQEIQRVVSPFGVYYLKQGGTWNKTIKPLISGMGEYKQNWGSETKNFVIEDSLVKVPTGLQWINDNKSPAAGICQNGYRFDNGLVYYDLVQSNRSIDYKKRESYTVCRNAFSGVLLWKNFISSAKPWTNKGKPVAFFGGRIYTFLDLDGYLVALDAKTGNVVHTYSNLGKSSSTNQLANFAYIKSRNQILLTAEKQVFLADTNGTIVWTKTFNVNTEFPVVDIDNNRAFFALVTSNMDQSRNSKCKLDTVVAVNLSNGNRLWSTKVVSPGSLSIPENPATISQLFYADGKLFLFRASNIFSDNMRIGAMNASTGSILWQKDEPKGSFVGQQLEAYAINGKLYTSSGGYACFDYNGNLFEKMGSPGNSRCDASAATPTMIFGGFQNFWDLKNRKVTRRDITRSNCATGTSISYGMEYYTGNRCFCVATIRGSIALANYNLWDTISDNLRLDKKISLSPFTPPVWPNKNEWPMLMGGPARTSSNNSLVPPSNPVKGWENSVNTNHNAKTGSIYTDWTHSEKYVGPVSSPVIADSMVFVSCREEGKVVAIDAFTGVTKWKYLSGGRIQAPPTIYAGLCFFTSADGNIYCLKAKTGDLVWKFFAGISTRKIISHGQLANTWMMNDVLIDNGVLFVNAGNSPDDDGGMIAWGLNPFTGAIIWRKHIDRNRSWYNFGAGQIDDWHYTAKLNGGYNANNVLNEMAYSDGEKVAIKGCSFNLNDGFFNAGGGLKFSLGLSQHSPYDKNLTHNWDGPGNGNGKSFVTPAGFTSSIACERYAMYNDSVIVYFEQDVLASDRILTRIEKGNNTKWVGPTLTKLSNSLILVDHYIVASSENIKSKYYLQSSGEINIFDAFKGTKIYTLTIPSAVVTNGLAAAYGNLYFTTEDGKVYCYGKGSNNYQPIAIAGSDLAFTENGSDTCLVKLDGSSSYKPFGSIVSYEWLEGAKSLSNSAIATCNVPFITGNHQVILKVTDNTGLISRDTINVLIRKLSAGISYRFLRAKMTTNKVGNSTEIAEVRFNSDGFSYPQAYDGFNSIRYTTNDLFDYCKGKKTSMVFYALSSASSCPNPMVDNNNSSTRKLKGDYVILDLTDGYKMYPDSFYINVLNTGTTSIKGDSIFLYGSNDDRDLSYINSRNWTKIATYVNPFGVNGTGTGGYWLKSIPTISPNAPSDLKASVFAQTVNLSWTDNSNNEQGFRIERKTGGAFIVIGYTDMNVNTFIDSTILPGISYTYRLLAYQGNSISAYSNSKTINVSADLIISPNNLTAGIISANVVPLQWQDNSTNETGFIIQRKTDVGSFVVIDTVISNTTQYIDSVGLSPVTNYSYRIYAYNSNATSNYSNTLVVSTKVPIPQAPSNLQAKAVSGNLAVTLTWQDNSSWESGFDIFFGTDSNNCVLTLSTGPDLTSVTLDNSNKHRFDQNTIYYFYIKANNAEGVSKSSNIDSAKTSIVTIISDGFITGEYKIYPNPSKKIVTVEIPQLRKEVEVTLLDMLGKVVYKSVQSSTFNFNVSGLNKGEYTLRLYDANSNINSVSIVLVK